MEKFVRHAGKSFSQMDLANTATNARTRALLHSTRNASKRTATTLVTTCLRVRYVAKRGTIRMAIIPTTAARVVTIVRTRCLLVSVHIARSVA